MKKSEACRYIAHVAQSEILKQNEATTIVSSSHDLYKLIVKTSFHNVDVQFRAVQLMKLKSVASLSTTSQTLQVKNGLKLSGLTTAARNELIALRVIMQMLFR